MGESVRIVVQPNIIEQRIIVQPQNNVIKVTPEVTTAALRGPRGYTGQDGNSGTIRTPLSFAPTTTVMSIQDDELIGEMDLHVFIDGAHQSFAGITANHNKTTGTIDFSYLEGIGAGSIIDIEKYVQP